MRRPPPHAHCRDAFTLMEMMVSMGVLLLMMVLVTQLFNSATTITTMGNNHMDADSQARAVFDRMSVDFSQILKRPDVDYYLKDTNNPELVSGGVPGNDQLAFFSQVPGYYTSGIAAGSASPVSLVGYRVNKTSNQLERYGCGLFWNGMASVTSGTYMPLVFSGSSVSSGTGNTISLGWPAATNMDTDSNYEPIGPEVFRCEYFYVLRGQTVTATDGTQKIYPSMLSDTPWDIRISGTGVTAHTSVNGMADVAAVGVVIAVINPKSRTLVSDAQLVALAGLLPDFPSTDSSGNNTTQVGYLEGQWESIINSGSAGIPRLAASSIRVYKRYFYLSPNTYNH